MNFLNHFSKILTTTAIGGMLFCCLIASEGKAQSDKERTDKEHTKSADSAFTEGEKYEVIENIYENKSSKINKSTESATRDSSGYRIEGQKNIKEEGKSTLSFNIFLYVLDRFKEN